MWWLEGGWCKPRVPPKIAKIRLRIIRVCRINGVLIRMGRLKSPYDPSLLFLLQATFWYSPYNLSFVSALYNLPYISTKQATFWCRGSFGNFPHYFEPGHFRRVYDIEALSKSRVQTTHARTHKHTRTRTHVLRWGWRSNSGWRRGRSRWGRQAWSQGIKCR